MATTIVYAAGTDTLVSCDSTVSYATARTGAGTLTLGSDAAAIVAAGQWLAGTQYICYESFLNFDTGIVAGASSVVLSMWPVTINTTGDELRAAVTTSTTPYSTASYISGASLPTSQATLASPVAGSYNDFTEVSLLANINPTGTTYLMVWGKKLQDGTPPTVKETIDLSSANEAGTTQDPKLTIVGDLAVRATQGAPIFINPWINF